MRANRLLIGVNAIAATAVIAVAAKTFVMPLVAEYLYKDQYKQLVFECDDVMRGHFIAKSRVVTNPSEGSIKNLRAAEVSLLTCHDYDKLRKRLLMYGVTDAELGSWGLEAIEDKAKDVRQFVETHEIRY